jgi:hypothetical protein
MIRHKFFCGQEGLTGTSLFGIVAAGAMGFFHESKGGALDLTYLRAYKYYLAPFYDFPLHLCWQN